MTPRRGSPPAQGVAVVQLPVPADSKPSMKIGPPAVLALPKWTKVDTARVVEDRAKHAPVNWFQTIPGIGKGTLNDNAHRIVEIRLSHLGFDARYADIS